MKQLMLVLMLLTAATLAGCDSANEDVKKEIPGPSTLPDNPDSD
jgi:uncharacterized lipoprotein